MLKHEWAVSTVQRKLELNFFVFQQNNAVIFIVLLLFPDLVLHPRWGDVGTSSVSQHQVSHAVHAGLLANLGAKCWLVALHLCSSTHTFIINLFLQWEFIDL